MINLQLINVFDAVLINLIIICAIISLIAYHFWIKTNKSLFVYIHVAFLFLPLTFLLYNLNCAMSLVNGLIALCGVVLTKVLMYLIPITIISSFVLGYFLIPSIYVKTLNPIIQKSNFLKKYSKNVKLFLLDKQKPVAFSVKNKIFASVGLFDILTKKEVEAVLLHEVYHSLNNSSLTKFSTFFAKMFSPIASFHTAKSVLKEEEKADFFAVKIQKTEKHLNNAKAKIIQYYETN